MSGWKLDPAGIQRILLIVNGEVDQMREEMVGTPEAPINHGQSVLEGLSWGLELTGPVTVAVDAVMAAQSERLQTISAGIAAAQLGVLNATMAYNRGDEEMAAAAQAAALNAADGDRSWFEQNGVS